MMKLMGFDYRIIIKIKT